MKKRLLLAIMSVAMVLLTGRFVPYAHADPAPFRISSLDCTGTPGRIIIANDAAAVTPLGTLTVSITPPTAAGPTVINVNNQISQPFAYSLQGKRTISAQVGPGSVQAPDPAPDPLSADPVVQQTIVLSYDQLLVPGSVVQLLNSPTDTTPQTVVCSVGSSFSVQQLTCMTTAGMPGVVTVMNNATTALPLAGLALSITAPGASTQTININNRIMTLSAYPPNTYYAPAGGMLLVQVGPGAVQTPNPVPVPPNNPTTPLPNGQTVQLSLQQLLVPGAVVSLVDQNTGAVLSTQNCPGGNGGVIPGPGTPAPTAPGGGGTPTAPAGGGLATTSANNFAINAVDCNSTPGIILIQNTSAATAQLDGLLVRIVQPNGDSFDFNVNNRILPPRPDYSVIGGGVVQLQVGSGATQTPNPAPNPLDPAQTVNLTTQNLLPQGTTIQLGSLGGVSVNPNGSTTLTFTPASNRFNCAGSSAVLIVSPMGFDVIPGTGQENTVCGNDLPRNTTPTVGQPGPCLTIQQALRNARDGDTILVEDGVFEVCSPIIVSKLVRITTREIYRTTGSASPTATSSKEFERATLHSFYGDTVFHVTAVGYPDADSPAAIPNTVATNVGTGIPANNVGPGTPIKMARHAQIEGFTIGGAFNPGAAAIFLDNDAYTDVLSNTLGGEPRNNPNFTGVPCTGQQTLPIPSGRQKFEPLGNATGIILGNSDHANIFANSILGSSVFKFSPLLATTGDVQTGFGIVTAECLGQGPDSSSGVSIRFNLIDRNVNAAIWLCSDGGGGHLLTSNIIRNNGRGILLRAITGTLLDANTISDDYQDGIIIYDAASNNTIQKSVIESHRTPGASGIRIGGFGGSVNPVQTLIANNTLRRNWTGVVITGARSTTLFSNVITAEVIRTGILLQVGSTGAPTVTQPEGTVLHLNQIISNGGCAGTQGCAIRLDDLVTADVDATQNNFGLPVRVDVNLVLWHKPNDPALGFIVSDQPNFVPVAPSPMPGVGAPGAPGAIAVQPGGAPQLPANNGGSPPTPIPQPAVLNTRPAQATATARTATATPVATVSATPSPSPSPSPSATPSAAATAGPAGPTTSPTLGSGQPGGSTIYSPPCNFVPVSLSVSSGTPAVTFLSQFQPVANIFSAWKYNNALHAFQALYFADTSAPVEVTTVSPGDTVTICLTDDVQGPP